MKGTSSHFEDVAEARFASHHAIVSLLSVLERNHFVHRLDALGQSKLDGLFAIQRSTGRMALDPAEKE